MNNLSEDLSTMIMLYVSHTCADIIHGDINQNEDSQDTFITAKRKTFTSIYEYDILPHYGNPRYYEDEYEYDVIRSHI